MGWLITTYFPPAFFFLLEINRESPFDVLAIVLNGLFSASRSNLGSCSKICYKLKILSLPVLSMSQLVSLTKTGLLLVCLWVVMDRHCLVCFRGERLEFCDCCSLRISKSKNNHSCISVYLCCVIEVLVRTRTWDCAAAFSCL